MEKLNKQGIRDLNAPSVSRKNCTHEFIVYRSIKLVPDMEMRGEFIETPVTGKRCVLCRTVELDE